VSDFEPLFAHLGNGNLETTSKRLVKLLWQLIGVYLSRAFVKVRPGGR